MKTPNEILASLPIVETWPLLLEISNKLCGKHLQSERTSLTIGSALNGDPVALAHATAATSILMVSIRLVDDLLDEDPEGIHHQYGDAVCANMALALQSVGAQALEVLDISAEKKLSLLHYYNRGAAEIAIGQDWDVKGIETEDDYWRIARMKSNPYYAACFAIEAIVSGVAEQHIEPLHALGSLYGEIIMLEDDIADVMAMPPKPDWILGRKPLPILFGLLVEHDEQAEFTRLFAEIKGKDIESAEPLVAEARMILVRSGAYSYAMHRLIDLFKQAFSLMDDIDLPEVETIRSMFQTDFDKMYVAYAEANAPLPV